MKPTQMKRKLSHCLMISVRACYIVFQGSDTCFICRLGYDNGFPLAERDLWKLTKISRTGVVLKKAQFVSSEREPNTFGGLFCDTVSNSDYAASN
jgi:hypothetical protein